MPNTIGDLRLYEVLELAQRLKVCPTTIRTYIKRGRLKATKIGHKYLISEESIKELFNAKSESKDNSMAVKNR